MKDDFEDQPFVPKEIPGNPDLNRYMRELAEDVRLTKVNLMDKALRASGVRGKWLNYYYLEKTNLKRIRTKKDEIVKAKLGAGTQSSILPVKNVDKISQEDETVKKLDLMAEMVKTNIDFLERALNIINDFGFTVKNSLEALKLEMS